MNKKIILIFIFLIFNLVISSPIAYTSKVTVNLVKPIIIEVNDINFGIYLIGQPAPKPKNIKIILKNIARNRSFHVSVPTSVKLSSSSGNDHPELDFSFLEEDFKKKSGSDIGLERNIIVSFMTLPKVPGEYIGTVTITADYN